MRPVALLALGFACGLLVALVLYGGGRRRWDRAYRALASRLVTTIRHRDEWRARAINRKAGHRPPRRKRKDR